MDIYLVDGTYELFRHYYGRGAAHRDRTRLEMAAVAGVLGSMLSLVEEGATHIGVATDRVIESFRNDLWPGYKTSSGVPADLLGQFPVLEEGLCAMGVTLWPMVELEADDALASAASVAADDPRVEQVAICTPDKDLAQCVVGDRVVMVDRRRSVVFDEDAVWAKFGVAPESIPDFLALVGDSADGFPGLAGWGKATAGAVLARYGHLEAIPADAADWDPSVVRKVRGAPTLATRLSQQRALVELFRELATLRIDRSLLSGVDDLAWRGPSQGFAQFCAEIGSPELAERAAKFDEGLSIGSSHGLT